MALSYKAVLKENSEETIIEKTGSIHKFTVKEVKDHLTKLAKFKKECIGQRDLEHAKMENVKNNHPEIVELPGEKLVAARIYATAKDIYDQCVAKLVEVEAVEKEYEEEIKQIKEQTGVEIV